MKYKNNLLNRIKSKKAKIGVIGLGYIGLPLCKLFLENDYTVYGYDIDCDKIQKLKNGISYIKHIDVDLLYEKYKQFEFIPESLFFSIIQLDVIILCVPTPLHNHKEPDLTFVMESLKNIIPFLKPGQVICLESTTYPGTTQEKLLPELEKQNFTIGRNLFLVYSPEREDPNNENFNTENIPKICSGVTDACLDVGVELYKQIINDIIPVSSTNVAEMTKILENTFRSVNIALVNELKMVCHKMGIDIFEVIRAASTKPFGFMPFYPGPGLGGHCIPIDPFYLTWKAKEFDIDTKFIELSGSINTSMPDWVIYRISEALNFHSKSINNSKILIVGISYKKNVDDMRESPAVLIMGKLNKKGANIDYYDPYLPKFPEMRNYYFDMDCINLNEEQLQKYDCVVITTDHDDIDYDLIRRESKLIVDTRGRYDHDERTIFLA